jgi:hypothetical protein
MKRRRQTKQSSHAAHLRQRVSDAEARVLELRARINREPEVEGKLALVPRLRNAVLSLEAARDELAAVDRVPGAPAPKVADEPEVEPVGDIEDRRRVAS